MSIEVFFSAALVGLAGAGHCIGMCGGISAALAFGLPDDKKIAYLLLYNVGRISSYVAIGFIAGALGSLLDGALTQFTSLPVLRLLAALMLVLMGFYVAGWWRVLTILERAGGRLWSRIQPLTGSMLPLKNGRSAVLLGMAWGWLPCGLVYSVLALALTQNNVWGGAAVMLAFGLGTAPALLLGGLAGSLVKIWLQSRWLRSIMGLSLIVFGLWTAVMPVLHLSHRAQNSDYTEEGIRPAHHH